MRLYVMRHGPAEDRGASGGDFDRPLSAPGRLAVRRVAAALQQLRKGMGPVRVLASPLLRAQETAAIVASLLGREAQGVETRPELGVDEPPATELVVELGRTNGDALLVGHQPSVEMLVRSLCDALPALQRGFRTATIVCLVTTPSGWSAERVLVPTA